MSTMEVDMATQDEVYRVWTVLAAAYPAFGRDHSPHELALTMQVYEQTLADLPGEVLQAAALAHIGSSKWFPTVAELRAAAGALMAPRYSTAMEAWKGVRDAMLSGLNSATRTPAFDNPITARVVKAMGWYQLCMSENQVADRAHFCEAYDRYVARAQEDALTLPQVAEIRLLRGTSE